MASYAFRTFLEEIKENIHAWIDQRVDQIHQFLLLKGEWTQWAYLDHFNRRDNTMEIKCNIFNYTK